MQPLTYRDGAEVFTVPESRRRSDALIADSGQNGLIADSGRLGIFSYSGLLVALSPPVLTRS